MRLTLTLVVALAAVTWAEYDSRKCWSAGNGNAARYWDEGSRVDRGRYWYECRNGKLEPRGCFTDTKRRINLHETYVQKNYEMKCVLKDGYLNFDYTACVPDGHTRYPVGETWEDAQRMYYMECKPDGPYIRIETVGCMSHDKTRRIPLNEAYDSGEYWYECKKKFDGSTQMCAAGCIHQGRRYKVGDSWPDGDFVYYCKLKDNKTKKICVGCQFQNKRLHDGDRYHKDNTVFQCMVRPNSFGHNAVGCVVQQPHGGTVERILGCRWYSEEGISKVEQECMLEGDKAVVKTLGCVYVHKGFDTLFINPDRYTIWQYSNDVPSVVISCKDMGNGNYRLEKFSPEQIPQRAFGMRYEPPRG